MLHGRSCEGGRFNPKSSPKRSKPQERIQQEMQLDSETAMTGHQAPDQNMVQSLKMADDMGVAEILGNKLLCTYREA